MSLTSLNVLNTVNLKSALTILSRIFTWLSFGRISRDRPVVLRIEITNRCNLQCLMCDRKALTRPSADMGMDLFARIIDAAAAAGIETIGLNRFGEPTLHPRLVGMVQYAKAKGIKHVSFVTNGTMMTDDLSRALIQSQCLDGIAFSVDGNTPGTYNRIRVGADFQNVVGNIENFIRIRNTGGFSKPSIQINTILMKDTEDELDETISRWRDSVDRVWVIPLMQYGGLTDIRAGMFRKGGDGRHRNACPQLAYMLVAFVDGSAGVCCIGDPNEELKIGDFNTQSLCEIWNGSAVEQVRQRHLCRDFSSLPPCARCDLTAPLSHWISHYLRLWCRRLHG
ncbi:MAG TPA: hypothetical protein DCM05_11905 [Elusimicrobia bacterium]|nr:hypothetical protein [Elusimicrobiota bacterium]